MEDAAYLTGAFVGVLFLVVLIPALVADLFRRRAPVRSGRMTAGWLLSLLLAAAGVLGGGSTVMAVVGVSIFALLSHMRVKSALVKS